MRWPGDYCAAGIGLRMALVPCAPFASDDEEFTPRGCSGLPEPDRSTARSPRIRGRFVDERSGDSCLEFGWVSLDTGWEISGAAAQDRVESEQHERGERVEQLRRRDPQPGRKAHETAAVEQVQSAPVDHESLKVASYLDMRAQSQSRHRAVHHVLAVGPHSPGEHGREHKAARECQRVDRALDAVSASAG
jgi:hypothetical protein